MGILNVRFVLVIIFVALWGKDHNAWRWSITCIGDLNMCRYCFLPFVRLRLQDSCIAKEKNETGLFHQRGITSLRSIILQSWRCYIPPFLCPTNSDIIFGLLLLSFHSTVHSEAYYGMKIHDLFGVNNAIKSQILAYYVAMIEEKKVMWSVEKNLTSSQISYYRERRGLESWSSQRIVTAQNWYPKIWAKFSLFVLHCIMAYIFKFAKLNNCQHWKS